MNAMVIEERFNWKAFCAACGYFKLYPNVSRRGMRFIIDTKCHECKKVHLDAVELSRA